MMTKGIIAVAAAFMLALWHSDRQHGRERQ
jgi:hypothetical protein